MNDNIKKQKMLIQSLRSENETLKETLTKISQQQPDQANPLANKDSNFESMRYEYEQAIEAEKQKISEIDNYMTTFQSKITQQKQAIGGVHAPKENQASLQKQIKTLENRLDQGSQKFNEAISVNRELRTHIDSLRQERVIFDNLYKKLEKELYEKRKNMADIIEGANTAYEDRDRANEQIEGLKQHAKRETNEFERDLKDLSQAMVKSHKALEYMHLAKNQQQDNERRTESEVEELRRQAQKSKSDKDSFGAIRTGVEKYEEDLARIQAATGITDFVKLIATFRKNEEKNYNTFKHVNDLSNEIETLEKTIAELKEERAKYEDEPVKKDFEKIRALKDLEETFMKLEGNMERFEFKSHEAAKKINSICNWTESMYNSLECDRIDPDEMGMSGVTESNLMACFSVIEERATQILAAYTQKKRHASSSSSKNQFDFMTNTSAVKNKYEAPEFDEFSDEDVDGEKPFTMEEFLQKATMKLETNKNTPAKAKGGFPKDKRR